MLEPEDYLTWRDHPMTQRVFAAMRAYAENRRDLWLRMSWEGEDPDPLRLHELRGQAGAVELFLNASYDFILGQIDEDDQLSEKL